MDFLRIFEEKNCLKLCRNLMFFKIFEISESKICRILFEIELTNKALKFTGRHLPPDKLCLAGRAYLLRVSRIIWTDEAADFFLLRII